MDYGMQEKTAGEPGLAKILGHLPEKRRRMCAINKPELAKKALLRCADARSQKGFCHNNEL